MGFIDSYLRLADMTKQPRQGGDVKSQMATMQSRMKEANSSMAAMTQRQQAANDPASRARRVSAVATVTSASANGTQINGSQLVDIQLLVMLPAGVPVALTVNELVSPLHLARLQSGSRIAVTLDPILPASVTIEWATPVD